MKYDTNYEIAAAQVIAHSVGNYIYQHVNHGSDKFQRALGAADALIYALKVHGVKTNYLQQILDEVQECIDMKDFDLAKAKLLLFWQFIDRFASDGILYDRSY